LDQIKRKPLLMSVKAKKNDAPDAGVFSVEDALSNHVSHILKLLGEDVTRSGLVATPRRVARMYLEVYKGLWVDPPEVTVFPNNEDGVTYDDMVIDHGYFFSLCEHHLVPFFGVYHYAYIPNKKIIGASKIGRVVDHFSARPQVAERLADQIITFLEKKVQPQGSILVMRARHLCKEMRGLKKYNSPFEVLACRGSFRKNIKNCKLEFLSRIQDRSIDV
jgi:GTP cyclohydrolase I